MQSRTLPLTKISCEAFAMFTVTFVIYLTVPESAAAAAVEAWSS